ncbi:MAG: hypothetical protein H6831_16265 [Planctomycetes bacterium]|nr:hypothetical protein [Planctomycetota bacterium]MCB9905955.1 hypothetical protein [Planctomycetota bacterium]
MQLAVAGEDRLEAARAVDDHWARDLSDAERAATEMVIDLDADEATCPACMTTFKTGIDRCPGCGLRLG